MNHLHDNERVTVVLPRIDLIDEIVWELHFFIKMDYDSAAVGYFPYLWLYVRVSRILYFFLQASKVAPIL